MHEHVISQLVLACRLGLLGWELPVILTEDSSMLLFCSIHPELKTPVNEFGFVMKLNKLFTTKSLSSDSRAASLGC